MHYIGTRTADEVTREYGVARELNNDIVRSNYREEVEALAQILSQGRELDMISSYGSWTYLAEAYWQTTEFPPAPPQFNYSSPRL